MHQVRSSCALGFVGLCFAACALPTPTTAGPQTASAAPASSAGRSGQGPAGTNNDKLLSESRTETPAPNISAAQSYGQAVNDLVAATRVRSSLLTANLRELERCKFAVAIAQGHQSVLESSFDVRQLNLSEFAEVESMTVKGEFVARSISCAESQRGCVANMGREIDSVTIFAATVDDVERARDALRQAQMLCSQARP